MMIIENGHRLMALGVDCPEGRYTPRELRTSYLSMEGESIDAPRRAFVEILHRRGGHPQLALIGGTLAPSATQLLEVSLHVSADLPIGAAATYPGAFGRNLVPGLPEDFVEQIPSALMTRLARPGIITIDRAAYDEAESSVHAFSLAADLLAVVLGCESPSELETAIRHRLAEW